MIGKCSSWNKLPGEVRKIIAEEAIGYRDQMAKQAVIKGKGAHGKFEKKGGKITKISTAERNAWAKSMPNVAKEWAASLEKKGIPGRKILSTYMDVMRSHKQPIVRQWDRE